jgi:DNA primase large subunit
MRQLTQNEVAHVSGAGGCYTPPPPCETKTKNNNGYGNGAESGPPPGNSGAHNPQLITSNSGPKGPR